MGDSSGSVSLTPFPASRTSCFLFARGSSKDLSPVSFTSSGERGLNSYAARCPRTSASSLYQRRIYNFDSLTDCPEAFQLPVTSLCGHTSSQCSFFGLPLLGLRPPCARAVLGLYLEYYSKSGKPLSAIGLLVFKTAFPHLAYHVVVCAKSA